MSIHHGDVLAVLPTLAEASVQCVVTSPPYWGLRDYGVEGQIGLEPTPQAYVDRLVEVFREVRRVLKDDGVVWLNLGDSYAANAATAKGKVGFESYRGSDTATLNKEYQGRNAFRGDGIKGKDLVGIPWLAAFALRADGWYLRSDVIWAKGMSGQRDYLARVEEAAREVGVAEELVNALIARMDLPAGTVMPESVKDRPTRAHEYVFLLSKSPRYFYDGEAVKEQGTWPKGTKAAKGSGKREGNRRGVEYATYSGKRNLRGVWAINPKPYREAHFATFPPDLVRPCVLAGSRAGDTVLDPFAGSGTVGVVCQELGREFVGIDLNPTYCVMATRRIAEAGA